MQKLSPVLAILVMAVFAGASALTAEPVPIDDRGGHAAGGGKDSPDWVVGEEMCARPA